VRYLIVAETYRDPEFARVNLHLAEGRYPVARPSTMMTVLAPAV
jgi:hypothetical protein